MNASTDRFWKMNGLGNDFIIFDGRFAPVNITPEQARALSNRASGIGCDQLIILEPSKNGGDVFMRILNADGSPSGACGNATRCVGWLLIKESEKERIAIETTGGLLLAEDAGARRIMVDMGEPKLGWQDIPLSESIENTAALPLLHTLESGETLPPPVGVSMGNPHAVFFVSKNPDSYDLGTFGPVLEHHPLFPERTNIEIAQVIAPDIINLRVWERGAGLTQACGTGACATLVAAVRRGLSAREAEVRLPGGSLTIRWRERDNHVLMTGLTELEFEGKTSELLAGNFASNIQKTA